MCPCWDESNTSEAKNADGTNAKDEDGNDKRSGNAIRMDGAHSFSSKRAKLVTL